VEQRYQAVLAVIRDGVSVVEVGQRFGVSRQAVHRWLRWYEDQGLPGLVDRSHRPPRCSHQMDPASRCGARSAQAQPRLGSTPARARGLQGGGGPATFALRDLPGAEARRADRSPGPTPARSQVPPIGARWSHGAVADQFTIRGHVRGILKKLDVHSMAQAAALAFERGIVAVGEPVSA
jgi:transposase-like protein